MRYTLFYKRCATVLTGLVMLFLLVTLTACQEPPAIWQEPDTVDVGEISKSLSEIEDNKTEGETNKSESNSSGGEQPETESYVVEDTDPGIPELHQRTPVFSAEGGIYDYDLAVTMTCFEDYTIRYTTNGSIPTKASTLYKGAVSVFGKSAKSMCIRAACFDQEGNIVGDVVTHTYIQQKPSEHLYTVSISVEQEDLRYLTTYYNEKHERPAHVEVVTPDGQTVISQDVGLRIFGGSSRSLPQKSFKIIARKDGYFGEDVLYKGGGSFKYPLFPERTVKSGKAAGEVLQKYDSFILRNGGNDSLHHRSVDPDDATLLRDGLANQFAFRVAEHVDVSLSQFARVYVNGEYYGLLDMRENLNEDYVKRVYGVADEDVVVVKSELDVNRRCSEHESGGACRYCNVWFYYETDEDAAAQKEMLDWMTLCRDTIAALEADEEAYAAAYRTLSDKVDLESFKEYMALNMFLCNTDWPHNNVKLWRYTGEVQEGIAITDGKWRFMTRDMDMAFARYSSPHITSELDNRSDVDTFYWVLGQYVDGYRELYSYEGEERLYPDSLYLQGLLAFCLQNDEFRADFAAYCRLLAGKETQTALGGLYYQGYDAVYEDIQNHVKRWFSDMGISRNWRDGCEGIQAFIRERGSLFEAYLEQMLGMYA